jgi:crotonobetainyl-CoA:carnitine CoA-transferase CaiB-like acyl-CoA transferase
MTDLARVEQARVEQARVEQARVEQARVEQEGPLTGYRVVDFATALAGPWAAGILGDHGAEVIKVERVPQGDLARAVGTRIGDLSAMFQMANRGKLGVALDLKSEPDRELARRLAASADVVVQNFRPSVAAQLGLAYDQLRLLNEDIIVVSIYGFGSVGPDSARAAFDSVIQAEAGFCALQAGPSEEPGFTEHTLVDKITALQAAQAVLAALLMRERGRGGQHLEVSMLEAGVELLWMDSAGNETLLDAEPTSTRGVTAGFRRFVAVADGWCSLSLGRPGSITGVCRALGLAPEHFADLEVPGGIAGNEALMDEFLSEVATAARTLTREEVGDRLRAEDLTYGIVRTLADAHLNPQLVASEFFDETDHPGVGRVRQPRPVVRSSTGSAPAPGRAPHLGEHTSQVLEELDLSGPDPS